MKVEIKIADDAEMPGYGVSDIAIAVDGEPIAEGAVGGEAEDNCRVRDYRWIVPAMKALAERLGAAVEVVETVREDDT